MKKKLSKTLALLLCLALCVSFLPAAYASADENDAEEITETGEPAPTEEEPQAQTEPDPEPQTEPEPAEGPQAEPPAEPVALAVEEGAAPLAEGQTPVPDENGFYHITSFEELKTLAAGSCSEDTVVYYEGAEDLVISEDITIPEEMDLHTVAGLVVPEGVTVTNCGYINVFDGAKFTKAGDIINDTGRLNLNYEVATSEAFAAAADAAAEYVYPNVRHNIAVREDIALAGNVWLQDNVDMFIDCCTLTIPTSLTMTNYGCINITGGGLKIEGTLVNDSYIYISVDQDNGAAFVSLAETGSYYGYGGLQVIGTEALASSPYAAIPGFERLDLKYMTNGAGWWKLFCDFIMLDVSSVSSFEELSVYAAYEYSSPVNLRYSGQLTLPEDLCIPANLDLIMESGASLTVPAETTLTVNGKLEMMGAAATVQGALENNGCITVYEDSLLSLKGGSYAGPGGRVWVYSTQINEPFDVLPGLENYLFVDDWNEGVWALLAKTAEEPGLAPDENGDYHITSFAQLKELAAMTDQINGGVYYDGDDALVIKEDLVLPFVLYAGDRDVVVPNGVSLTVGKQLNCGGLTVYGEMHVNEACNVNAYGDVAVNGAMTLSGYLLVNKTNTLSGEENIAFTNDWASIRVSCYALNQEELKTMLAAADDGNRRKQYDISLLGDVELSESLAIPGGCGVYIIDHATVMPGAELTVQPDGQLGFGGLPGTSLVIKGSLVNNGYISVYEAASLELNEEGSYSGSGTIIMGDAISAPETVLPGFDMDLFDITEDPFGNGGWQLRHHGGIPMLGTPAELTWSAEKPGTICWKNRSPIQEELIIEVYKDGQSGPVWGAVVVGLNADGYHERDLSYIDFESGDYFFTVKALGDYVEYRDSETAASGIWSYVRPEAQIGLCSVPVCSAWPEFTWTAPENGDISGYQMNVFYAPSLDTEPVLIDVYGGWDGAEPSFSVNDYAIRNFGEGYYYASVRALSSDISVACNGGWTELSEHYYVSEQELPVGVKLDNIAAESESMTEGEIREAVSAIGTDELKSAMEADNGGLTDASIRQLEERFGVTRIDVDENMAESFDVNKVTMLGAALNTPEDENEDIVLNIGAPEESELVIPEEYDGENALKFSMTMENIADAEKLAVPIKITLPVPKGMDPDTLVVLHYHEAGAEPEVIEPQVFTGSDGLLYASFVVASFSDFVLTDLKPAADHMPGDINGDGLLDAADFLVLMKYHAGEEIYVVKAALDVNGDGVEDAADFLVLMKYQAGEDITIY